MTFDDLFRAYAHPAPGAAVLVLAKDRPPVIRTAGVARLEEAAPVTPRTGFRLASLTKAFTAKAVDLAIARGLLALDMPIRRLLPGLPGWAELVRLGHLLAHTSALPAYESLVPPDCATRLTDADVLRLLATGPAPARPPGARFEYDNGGYVLLGLGLEAVTGMALPDVLRDWVFGPLGMDRTVAYVEGRTRVEDRALGCRRDGERWVDADQGVTTATLGDGGVYSCLEDLARWDAALRDPAWAPDPARLAPWAAPVGPGVAYGWGWFLDELEGRRRQRHEGWSTGFQNEMQRYPEAGVTVVVLTNRADPPARALAEAAARDAIGRTS